MFWSVFLEMFALLGIIILGGAILASVSIVSLFLYATFKAFKSTSKENKNDLS